MSPLLSVITVNRNNAVGLERTLTSVAAQSFDNFEQIVVDGASTDGSVEVIRTYKPPPTDWISEPDSGVYHAMNKGIRLAHGEYILFLNSGDHFIDHTSLERAVESISDADIQCFDLLVRHRTERTDSADYIKSYPDRISFSYMAVESLPHPATLIRTRLFKDYGLYDQTLRISADWKSFMLWLCKYNCSYKHHAFPLSVFYLDGLSSDPSNRDALLDERRSVLRTEFPAFESYLQDLDQAQEATRTLAALRQSKVIRLLKSGGLLWDF